VINPTGEPICPHCTGSWAPKTVVDEFGCTQGVEPMTRQEKVAIHDLLGAIGMHP
jgi:hypothetical protein